MATKVSVITNPGNRVAIGRTTGGVTRIGQLTDVNTIGKANNDVLVYDVTTDTYISKPIPIIDCGEF
jgi:hypothetical protein